VKGVREGSRTYVGGTGRVGRNGKGRKHCIPPLFAPT